MRIIVGSLPRHIRTPRPTSQSIRLPVHHRHSKLPNTRPFTTSNTATMRLPYVDDDPKMSNQEDQEIVERVKKRRGGKLIELDKALLHAPPIAGGWNAMLGAVRTQNSLADSVREVAISRVAALNQAWYEWEAHAPLLEKTGAVSKEAIDNLKDRTRAGIGLDEKHLAVLEVTDEMTLNVVVPQGKFDKLKKYFSDREIVEICATVSAYNMVSRFLVSLDIGEMGEKYGVSMK